MTAKETISNNVKLLRKRTGMTQKEFADKAQITRSIVTNIEQGHGTSIDVLEQLGRTFNVSMEYFIRNQSSVPNPMNIILDDTALEQCNIEFGTLPPYVQTFTKLMAVQLSKYFNKDNKSTYPIIAGNKEAYAAFIKVISPMETKDEAFKKEVMQKISELIVPLTNVEPERNDNNG